ncbi:intradiol ring-cleavage dioxygenase [Ekhidna sp.]|uniref:dioxygenase family protein n=1 Tax=Ekhidna sp. TaxID=2608089 RepID=UPI003298F215
MKNLHYPLLIVTLFCCSFTQENNAQQPSCEWCGATEAPSNITSSTTIADSSEKGERIKISGTVYQPDGRTPAGDVILYVYHTNTEGVYPKKGNETGNGRRHGYLRSWIKTGSNGNYSFETIKPEPYPGRTVPAHIHITVKHQSKKEYWLKDFFFYGDNLLSEKDIKNETGEDRFNHVIRLIKQGELLAGKRDILLKN